jgi:hypothetical protein
MLCRGASKQASKQVDDGVSHLTCGWQLCMQYPLFCFPAGVMRVAGDLFLFYGTCLVRMVTMYLVAHKPLGLQILKLCKVVLLPNTMFLDVRLVLVCM